MKKIIILMLAGMIGLTASAQGQPQKNKNFDKAEMEQKRAEMAQKMESAKIAFYTEAIGLSPEEAKDFWPLYDAIDADQKKLNRAEHSAFKALNDAIKEGKGDAEISKLLSSYIEASQANVNLHFKAAGDYNSILPPVKVAKFFAAQERFRRQQFNNLRVNSPHGNHNGPGNPAQGGFHGGQNGPRPDFNQPK